MCLDKLAKFEPCEVGYKVMKIDFVGDLHGEFYNGEVVPQNVWLDEKKFRLGYYSKRRRIVNPCWNCSYPFGFHIYHYKKDALSWWADASYQVCVKVAIKEPRAVGYQNNRRITVAKQIKVLSIVKQASKS